MRRFSAKQKKELYSLTSLLFHLLVFIVLLISLGTDADDEVRVSTRKVNTPKEAPSAMGRFFASAHQKM
ncbi:hypothetical protein AAE02nite_14510 [Adhaeribacter aerolatus]|uniref:Uncharacterized protein n=1 Tax=Adhaeribacter aerolatus TaxID=670289 RepID=A0A512AWA1_9BACT|nr:hypothetical protein [Adhaeribacter aerolatus]GEO03787.1 hypothetical protein AAE02nite_14510 [Adhaeribacter aerolatus]